MSTTTVRDQSSHAAVGISVTSIVQQTLAVVADPGVGGVGGLTMAAVARRLGVRTPTLYHHVRDKAALLELVAQTSFEAMAPDSEAYGRVTTVEDWIELTYAGSLQLRGFYAGHPGLAALIQTSTTRWWPGHGPTELSTAGPDVGQRSPSVHAPVQALVRIGVPADEAFAVFDASARWTLAAIAAEDRAGGRRDDWMFVRGLRWLMAGLRLDLSGSGSA